MFFEYSTNLTRALLPSPASPLQLFHFDVSLSLSNQFIMALSGAFESTGILYDFRLCQTNKQFVHVPKSRIIELICLYTKCIYSIQTNTKIVFHLNLDEQHSGRKGTKYDPATDSVRRSP